MLKKRRIIIMPITIAFAIAVVVIITLFMHVMRSDIDCRSTEEDELPGK